MGGVGGRRGCEMPRGQKGRGGGEKKKKKKHHERSVGCLAFNGASESFDSDFRMGKFYCARQRLELTVAQHSRGVADDGWNLHAAAARVSPLHQNIKKKKKESAREAA